MNSLWPTTRHLARLGIFALLFALFLVPLRAHAVLGEDLTSIPAVVDALKATRHDVEIMSGGVTLHRIQTANLEVREYVATSTGQVVGIAWSGKREPRQIAAILGHLLPEYVQSMHESHGHGPSPRLRSPASFLHSPHLVIERFSRMGFSRARIYLAELPSEVSADAIR